MNKKLDFNSWMDKYFTRPNSDQNYLTWSYTDDGMAEQDKSRWKIYELYAEYDRYVNNDSSSWIGLANYDE